MNRILQIKNLGKNYHTLQGEVEAIRDISFDINDGEFIAIVGSSGCGKSSLLHILAGLENKSRGLVQIEDGKNIGYMLQEDALLPWLTIMDNVLLGLKIRKILNHENRVYALKLLENYDLGDFKDKYPSCLSGGMRQRVG